MVTPLQLHVTHSAQQHLVIHLVIVSLLGRPGLWRSCSCSAGAHKWRVVGVGGGAVWFGFYIKC